jgi:hypothetical protein
MSKVSKSSENPHPPSIPSPPSNSPKLNTTQISQNTQGKNLFNAKMDMSSTHIIQRIERLH